MKITVSKTKGKFISLVLSLAMILTLLAGLTISTSAAEIPVSKATEWTAGSTYMIIGVSGKNYYAMSGAGTASTFSTDVTKFASDEDYLWTAMSSGSVSKLKNESYDVYLNQSYAVLKWETTPTTDYTLNSDSTIQAGDWGVVYGTGSFSGTYGAGNTVYIYEVKTTGECEHNYEGAVTKEATCVSKGVKTYTCSKCGASYTEDLPMLEHSYDEGVVTKEATCSKEGTKTYTCSFCKQTKTEAIAKLAHTFSDGVCTVCGAKQDGYVPELGLNGEGTETAPYEIETQEDLSKLASFVNDGYSTKGMYFELQKDLNLDVSYVPIGNYKKAFNGTFEGNYHYVTLHENITTGANACTGLFGYVNGGTIKDVIVRGDVNSTGGYNVAAVVGKASCCTISNCGNEANVTNSGETSYAGGVVGASYGDVAVLGCYNAGSVQASNAVGGIVGNCEADTPTGEWFYNNNYEYLPYEPIMLNQCYNIGALTAKGVDCGDEDSYDVEGYVGGLIGYEPTGNEMCWNVMVTNSYAANAENYDAVNIGVIAGTLSMGSVDYTNVYYESYIPKDEEEPLPWTPAIYTWNNNTTHVEPVLFTDYDFSIEGFKMLDGVYVLDWQNEAPKASEAHEHSFGDATVVEPTCTEKGYTYETCSDPSCGYVYKFDETAAKGHDLADAVSNEDGTHSSLCKTCGEKITDVCTFDDGVLTKEAGKDTEGVITYTCSVCKGTKTESIPATGFDSDENGNLLISSADDLETLSEKVEAGQSYSGYSFVLTDNVTLTNWEGIGSSDNQFAGSFNGNYHTITITGTSGLFGYLYGANVEKVIINGTINSKTEPVGGIARTATNTNITYCGNNAKLDGKAYVAGIVAQARQSVIKACYNKGEITDAASTDSYAGGITSTNTLSTVIQYCYNLGKISSTKATSYGYAGGISAMSSSCQVLNCYNAGEISGLTAYVGGIIGSGNNYYQQGGYSFYLEGTAERGNGRTEDVEGYITSVSDVDLSNTESEAAEALGSNFVSDINNINNGFLTLAWEYNEGAEISYITEINTADEMRQFANAVRGGHDYEGETVSLMADIDLEGVLESESESGLDENIWTAIGDINGTVFEGTFDGQNHSIKGMIIVNQSSGYLGLFSVTGMNAVIKDLNLYGAIETTLSYPGSFAGLNLGTITGCTSNVKIKTASSDATKTTSGCEYVGGIAGDNAGSIINCTNNGEVYAPNSTYVGGIAGHVEPYYTTDTEVKTIAGTDPLIKGCVNNAKVTGYDYVGGIAGGIFNDSTNLTLKNLDSCLSAAVVYSPASDSLLFEETNERDAYVGSLCGHISNEADITNCYYVLDVNDDIETVGDTDFSGDNYASPVSASYAESDEMAGLLGRTEELVTEPETTNKSLKVLSAPVNVLKVLADAKDSDMEKDDVWTINAYETNDGTRIVVTRLKKAYTNSLVSVEYGGQTYTNADSTDVYGNVTQISFTVEESFSDEMMDNIKVNTESTGIKLYVNGQYVKTLDKQVFDDYAETEPVKFTYQKTVNDTSDSEVGKTVTKYSTVSSYLTMDTIALLAGVENDDDLVIKMRPVDYTESIGDRTALIDDKQILALSMYSGDEYVNVDETDSLNAPRLIYAGDATGIQNVKWVNEIYVTGNALENGDLSLSGASLSLKNNTDINIYVNKTSVAGYEKYGVKACKTGTEDSNELTYEGESSDGTCYVYKFAGVTAKEFADNYTFTAYGIKDGKEISGAGIEYSVKAYCMNKLSSADSKDALKKVCADLLNYGAAAQVYFDYETDNLANKDMTEEESAYASKDVEAVTQTAICNTEAEEILAKFNAASLSLKNSVEVNVFVTSEDSENLTFKVWVDNDGDNIEDDNEVNTVNGTELNTYDNEKVLKINTIDAKDMRSKIHVTAYKAGKIVSNELVYSIESYCAAKADSSNENLKALCGMLMKFVDSAAAYFE